ncbi:hypothetical protein FACS1894216_11790 [Synergistales bacterium]|nr:hypothetical protein FACS1894216_11790 [Synergistales bacterium]
MGNSLVSIVVPIYNTQEYLNRCVDSLLNQTYENIEVLLVDDGSTDGSEKICDEYVVSDKRAKVIHKANGGEASARNAGLFQANGDYLMFCDSDDEYLPYAVEKLVKGIESKDADLCEGAYLEKTGDVTRFVVLDKNLSAASEIVVLMLTDSNAYGARYIISTVNGAIFRMSIIRDNKISFAENFVVGNDTLFVCDYLKHCRRVYSVFEPVYVYYKFALTERVQGMAWFYPDIFQLTTTLTEKLLSMSDIDEAVKTVILSQYFDSVVRQLVKAATYEEYFPDGLIPHLKKLIPSKLMQDAAYIYKRERIGTSRLIPLCIKLKAIRPLYFLLRRRAKRIHKQAENVRLMVKY